ncbi:MAG: trigger factor [Lachnospiraceae bacterium]|nr:trigger factor [Lachnospiraceae bacterium]
MNVQVEKLEGSMAKLIISVEPEKVDEACDKAYKRIKNRISVPGFRKGKVPKNMIEKMYGPEIFYEDASQFLINENYPNVFDQIDEDVVSSPEIEVKQIEKGKEFIFEATVALRPPVKLGKYKGVSVTKIDTDVTDEDVQKDIDNDLKRNSRMIEVTDRAAQKGDTVVLDFKGTIDGVAFEGGSAENHTLELGSGTFIPGFEEQLEGVGLEEDVDVKVTFPEDYQAKELAGKDAVFACRIHTIRTRELPELADYVDDQGFDSEEDYKKDVRERIEKRKENEARRAYEDEAIAKIVADSEIELPEAMVETQLDSMVRDYAMSLRQSGLRLDDYLKFSNMTEEQLRTQMRPDAEDRLKGSLVLEEIAEVEKLEASDEDIDKKIEDMAAMYGMPVDSFKKDMPDSERDRLKKEITMEKAIDVILDNKKETKKRASKKDDE